MKCLVATRNAHKLKEIRAIVRTANVQLVGLDERPPLPEVEEDGATFEANAGKKASVLARHAGMWTLADDSGLEVEVLNGAPGVRSARYAGEPRSDAANNRKLLAELAGQPNRKARFRCVIALSNPDGQTRTVEGRCDGRLLESPRGQNGFGYDPLFVPDGHTETFAEMKDAEKNRISHRARALQQAAETWWNGPTPGFIA